MNIKLMKILLLEEEDDEEILLNLHLSKKKRKNHDPLFQSKDSEVYHKLLINGHLKNNETKFMEFFR